MSHPLAMLSDRDPAVTRQYDDANPPSTSSAASSDVLSPLEVPQVVKQLEELPGVRELQQLALRAQSTKKRLRVQKLAWRS